MKREIKVYVVELYDTEGNRQERHLFTSIAAIYDVLTKEQIGVPIEALYAVRLPQTGYFENKKCSISRENVFTKQQKNKADS